MAYMSVTLEMLKLSGWLKAIVYCRVQRGHPVEGSAWHGDGIGGRANQQRARGVLRVAQLGSADKRRRRKRTWNM